ncbi:DUF2929 family protein [Lactococcus termiticola]|uniref:DUF2929 domain-containing protein n=1 Tax=Lactococcus termiticola TaxID=2169526 RepID=A0A2R5HFJ4_9LACT|nr:DUF2929 family protein [Lactococcus termiticola]GBG96075.1 hypothetical protein NtB2_00179 [Lactococcus termiticola]
MKVIVTLFWTLVIGQVVGYIMTALAGVPDNPLYVLYASIGFAIFILIFQAIAVTPQKKA